MLDGNISFAGSKVIIQIRQFWAYITSAHIRQCHLYEKPVILFNCWSSLLWVKFLPTQKKSVQSFLCGGGLYTMPFHMEVQQGYRHHAGVVTGHFSVPRWCEVCTETQSCCIKFITATVLLLHLPLSATH